MDRADFDRHFAATENTTEGYSDADLAVINDAVFAEVADCDINDLYVASTVSNMFGRVFAKFDGGQL